jgi:hypothetical protein
MVYSLESEAALPPTMDGETLVSFVSEDDDDDVREMSISVDDIIVSYSNSVGGSAVQSSCVEKQ